MTAKHSAYTGAQFALQHGPARSMLAIGGVACALMLFFELKRPDLLSKFLFVLFTVLGAGLARQSVGHDRKSGCSVLYFQRPVTPVAHYTMQLALAIGILAVFAAGAILIGAGASIAGSEITRFWIHAVAALYWGTLLLVIGMALSALVGPHEISVIVLLLFVSFAQKNIVDLIGTPSVAGILRWALLPVDAFVLTWERGTSANWATISFGDLLQLAVYPAAWAVVFLLAVRNKDEGAANYASA